MENKINISKELFIKCIYSLKKQISHDKKCAKAFATILDSDHTSVYNTSFVTEQLVDVLKEFTNDENGADGQSWIEYYIWELNFGANYKDGDVKIDGKNFRLTTPNDLWDLLNYSN